MITTAATIAGKSSMNEATFVDGPSSFTSPRSLLKSTSINSLKMPHEQPIRVNSTDPENLLSQTRLQTMLSRFRQDVEPTPIRLDMKRSSVWLDEKYMKWISLISIYIFSFLFFFFVLDFTLFKQNFNKISLFFSHDNCVESTVTFDSFLSKHTEQQYSWVRCVNIQNIGESE